MKVIFLEDIPNVASAGDVKNVSDGYARNYLLPRKLAVLATPGEARRVESIKKAASARVAKAEEGHRALAQHISGLTVTLTAKAGEGGRLYGSVTSADIAQKLSALIGYEIDKRKVELAEPLKALGAFDVPVKLSPTVEAKARVVVEAEGGTPAGAEAAATAEQPSPSAEGPAGEEPAAPPQGRGTA